MKQLILTIVAATLVLCSCSKTNQFKVNLNLENAGNQTVYLYKDADVKHVLLDSAVFVGKNAELTADFDDPQTCYIIKFNRSEYESCGDNFTFFTENQNTTIAGDMNDMPHWTVQGCPTMNILNDFHQQSLVQFEDPLMGLYAEMGAAVETGDTLRVFEINEQLPPLMEGYFNNQIDFIRNHSDSYIAHYMLYLMREELEPEMIKELAAGFTTESMFSKKVKEYLEQNN